jgi:hypothetical protein
VASDWQGEQAVGAGGGAGHQAKTESISMDLLEEAAAAGTFKLAAKTQVESAQP